MRDLAIGVAGHHDDGALLDFDYREVKVSQAIIENARKVILVADRLKLERAAPVKIAHLSQIHTFITDSLTSPQLRELCATHNVEVIETVPGGGPGSDSAAS